MVVWAGWARAVRGGKQAGSLTGSSSSHPGHLALLGGFMMMTPNSH